MIVQSLFPNIEGASSLDTNKTVRADYYLDIGPRKEDIMREIESNISLDQEPASVRDIIDGILDFSMNGLLYVSKDIVSIDKSLEVLLPKPN